MIKSKHFRGAVAAWLLVLLSFAGGVRAEISPSSAGDELLQILPAESLFCVRLNNFDDTFGRVDQFLTGVSPMPMGVSMLVRMQFAKMLGSPELNGVNMGGSFALFGVTPAGKPPGSKPSDMFIGALVPITDYKQFIDGNPNLSPPDANGVSKNSIMKTHRPYQTRLCLLFTLIFLQLSAFRQSGEQITCLMGINRLSTVF